MAKARFKQGQINWVGYLVDATLINRFNQSEMRVCIIHIQATCIIGVFELPYIWDI